MRPMVDRRLDRLQHALRPLVPPAAIPALVALRSRRARSDQREWGLARQQMRFLTGVRDPDADIDALAARYIRLMKWRGEMRWHPRSLTTQQVVGLEHLADARAGGRGVVVSFMHHAFYDGLFGSLAHRGIPCNPVLNPAMYADGAPAWLTRQRDVMSLDAPAINAASGTPAVVAALRAGAVVGIATDWASSTTMDFLGRRVLGASGAARIAHELDVPVVVATSRRDGERDAPAAHFVLSQALQPSAFDSVGSLLREMVVRHESAVSVWPEAYDQPLVCWRWDEGTASPQAVD